MKSPAAVYKLPGRYGFHVILITDHSGRRHTHADAPAIFHAREISIRQQATMIRAFDPANMSAPPFFLFSFREA